MIAVIGSGFMGRTHLEALRRIGLEAQAASARTPAQFHAAIQNADAVHICTPNASHAWMVRTALEAGKHVLCEKPLAISSAEASHLVALARARNLRNCTCYNLRYYPMVQHIRAMIAAGELGEILILQGTYSQDWLLYPTDWNWRVDPESAGPSRALADIGTHWCDWPSTSPACASLGSAPTCTRSTARTKPADPGLRTQYPPADSSAKPFRHSPHSKAKINLRQSWTISVQTEDFGSVMFHTERRGARLFHRQPSLGRPQEPPAHRSLRLPRAAAAWDQENPNQLWIGNRDSANQVLLKDPALLAPSARAYADYPGGHAEGYPDTFKQLFERFYQPNPGEPDYPQFSDGIHQLQIVEAALESHRSRGWVAVPASQT